MTAVLEERAAYRDAGGYLKIEYKCSACGKIITFPEQQGFRYCYLCGSRIRRIEARSLTWNPLSYDI